MLRPLTPTPLFLPYIYNIRTQYLHPINSTTAHEISRTLQRNPPTKTHSTNREQRNETVSGIFFHGPGCVLHYGKLYDEEQDALLQDTLTDKRHQEKSLAKRRRERWLRYEYNQLQGQVAEVRVHPKCNQTNPSMPVTVAPWENLVFVVPNARDLNRSSCDWANTYIPRACRCYLSIAWTLLHFQPGFAPLIFPRSTPSHSIALLRSRLGGGVRRHTGCICMDASAWRQRQRALCMDPKARIH